MGRLHPGYPKVDVHSHFLPDFYREALAATGHAHPDGMPAIPEWDPDAHLALMDEINMTHGILSVSSPGVCLYPSDPAKCADLARRCNVVAADLHHRHPGRFGFWAALPMPFVDESLAEIDAVLGRGGTAAAGVGFMTSYPGGKYLGDEDFEPIWKRLDELGASVFIHPTTPCAHLHYPDAPPDHRRPPPPMLEFPFDTARSIASLLISAVPSRYPNITFVVCHAGGALPPLLSRIALFADLDLLPPSRHVRTTGTEAEMRELLNTRFYFDVAGAVMPGQLVGLVQGMGVGPGRLLYGSDYPFTPAGGVRALVDKLESGLADVVGEDGVGAVLGVNAKRFIGRMTKLQE